MNIPSEEERDNGTIHVSGGGSEGGGEVNETFESAGDDEFAIKILNCGGLNFILVLVVTHCT
jgi:hypothetical protein